VALDYAFVLWRVGAPGNGEDLGNGENMGKGVGASGAQQSHAAGAQAGG